MIWIDLGVPPLQETSIYHVPAGKFPVEFDDFPARHLQQKKGISHCRSWWPKFKPYDWGIIWLVTHDINQ